jgi:RNA polymerase sigma factor (sigma-70 family)
MTPDLLAAAANYTPMPESETQRLIRLARDGLTPAQLKRARAQGRRPSAKARAAREKILHKNILLVTDNANKLANKFGLTQAEPIWQDLVQEGLIGLNRAIDLFNPSRKVRFSTYATWCIRSHVRRFLQNNLQSIRIPNHIHDRRHKRNQAEQALTADLQRAPTRAELATRTGLTLEQLDQIDSLPVNHSIELYAPNSENENADSYLAAPEASETTESDPLANQTRHLLKHIRAALSDRNADIVIRRFGLQPGRGSDSFRTLAREFKMSPENARLIVRNSLVCLAANPQIRNLWSLVTDDPEA